jgi:hypothetical protein
MRKILLSTAIISISCALPAASATITSWNTGNVDVDTSVEVGVTGTSEVYDQPFDPASPPPAIASSGTIVFTPNEALSPGIKVQPESYSDTGQGATLTLDGCLMTSNPSASCTSPFQSGKRIKQQVTGFDPVDLVFNLADTQSTANTFYQVFGRLINVTDKPIEGFTVELGFGGAGDPFTLASADQLAFSTDFTAQPNNSGKTSSTQFPFGLFGAADDSPNFLLDGFFDDQRTGLDLAQTSNTLTATQDDYFGEYANMFGLWNAQSDVPEGLFWDADGNPETDALLMAWQLEDGVDFWELRRTTGQTCDPSNPAICTPGETLGTYVTGTYHQILSELTSDPFDPLFSSGAIEDLANLNLNYALKLGDLGGYDSFTIRTSAFPSVQPAPVPLPASASLLIAGLGLIGWFGRRRVA